MGTLINVDYNRSITLEEAKRYIPNFEKCYKYFSEEAILAALNSEFGRFGSFVTFEYVPVDRGDHNYHEKNYLKIAEHVSSYVRESTTIRGETWERTVSKICDKYLVPNKHDLNSSNLYKFMLLHDYPYLINYHMNVYHLDREGYKDEFYPSMKNGDEKLSLYVPYIALREKEPQIIIDRVSSYWKWYYNSPNRKEYLDKQLSILDWDSTKEFLEHVRTGK